MSSGRFGLGGNLFGGGSSGGAPAAPASDDGMSAAERIRSRLANRAASGAAPAAAQAAPAAAAAPMASAPAPRAAAPSSARAPPPAAAPPPVSWDQRDQAILALAVVKTEQQALVYENKIFLAPPDLASLALGSRGASGCHVEVGGYVYWAEVHPSVAPGQIALSAPQRKLLRCSVGDKLDIKSYFIPPQSAGHDAALLTVGVNFLNEAVKTKGITEIDAVWLSGVFNNRFVGQIMSIGQTIPVDYQGTNINCTVTAINLVAGADTVASNRGRVAKISTYVFESDRPGADGIKITNQKGHFKTNMFKTKDFNFEKLGIGGLDKQFEQIFRRAFASRVYPPDVVEKLGIKHVKGMLLYGPPGTGKTLIARQIGKLLNSREPKIVNGPEVLNKYVGQSEENVRKLFEDAEKDQAQNGDESDLHIIIFDEIDAICKQRGRSGGDAGGVSDSLVNQLLTKIDGVNALNNILLIGMTNRRDMLDEALMRPGRLEVQIEVGLPDEKGRMQILQIHTSKMSQGSFMGRGVDLASLAARTKNYSGAEIEGLVKSAVSFALNRHVDISDLSKPMDDEDIKVEVEDFEQALTEVRPAFGVSTESLEACRLFGIIDYGSHYQHVTNTLKGLVQQSKTSERTPLLSCLLEGPPGSGKTALAATQALESDFFFVRMISPNDFVGYSESAKCSAITRIFDDAYKSPLSILILDDIERLLEYVAIGPRFSNSVLQTLLVLIKKRPPEGRKLVIIGTTSLLDVMSEMEVQQAFNVTLNVPNLMAPDILKVFEAEEAFAREEIPQAAETIISKLGPLVPIKKLLVLLEMSRQGDGRAVKGGGRTKQRIPFARWSRVLEDLAG